MPQARPRGDEVAAGVSNQRPVGRGQGVQELTQALLGRPRGLQLPGTGCVAAKDLAQVGVARTGSANACKHSVGVYGACGRGEG